MLDTLRANSRSVITYVLFGIIIVVFVVSFGPGSKGCTAGGRSETWAAKVNGVAVTPAEFLSQYREMGGGRGQDDPFIRRQAMDLAVRLAMVEQEAQRHGIVVSDEELAGAITRMREFQGADGRFDPDLYRRRVTANYGSQGRYEEERRRQLAVGKVVELVASTVNVSEGEVKEAWTSAHDQAALQFALFSIQQARQGIARPSDAEVTAFAASSGARIEQYYKENPARFNKQARVKARHILVKVAEDAPQAEQEAARKKIDDLAARLKKGEDFAHLAEEYSDDPGSKAKGGELGFFGKGLMAKPFEDAAFKLKPGELSAPVRTQFGWHLIKVEAVEEPQVVSLDQARPEIAREILEGDLAKERARKQAEAALARLREGQSFAQVFPAPPTPPKDAKGADTAKGQPAESAKPTAKGPTAEETGPFTASRAPFVPGVGQAPALFADAMKASAGQLLPKVYETPLGFVVARVKERERPDESKWAAERPAAEAALRSSRQQRVLGSWVEGLRAKAKVTINPAFMAGSLAPSQTEND